MASVVQSKKDLERAADALLDADRASGKATHASARRRERRLEATRDLRDVETVALASAATKTKRERTPNGYVVDADGYLVAARPKREEKRTPLTDDDLRAYAGVVMLADIPGRVLTSLVMPASATAKRMAQWHAAYKAAYGYPARDHEWILMARLICMFVVRLHTRQRVPGRIAAELRELAREIEERGYSRDLVNRVVDGSQLGRGGGQGNKRQSVTRAVLSEINRERRREHLPPLTDDILER